MGVPALFRWLSQKYPKIIQSVQEEQPVVMDDGTEIPVDARKPNPNGFENDNLYLDMNGIVHPCSHPEDRAPPENEEEMMTAVFEYTNRVVNMVRPRRLLMIAVDGVAPRAKMNQQRSRRFRSAQEAQEKDQDKEEFLKLLRSQAKDGVIAEETEANMTKKTWDSNSITPGTPFMNLLAESLRYWVKWKLNTDPAWENLKVIISDATVPGEGEHKIMEFVRSQRRSPHHDPNTKHVIYGLDADLIMLGLATHEPYFRVLREDVFADSMNKRACKMCGQIGHYADQCHKFNHDKKASQMDEIQAEKPIKPFIWLHVPVLREYLAAELSVPSQGFQFDLERAVDDWVFMCFFVGNDFLPHLPSLDIRENGIDTLIAIWRDNIPHMRGYVTKDGHVDLNRAQVILNALAKQESAIFKRRKESDDRRLAAEKRREEQRERNEGHKRPRFSDQNNTPSRKGKGQPEFNSLEQFVPGEGWKKTPQDHKITHDMVVNSKASIEKANVANKSAAAVLKERMRAQNGSTDSLGSAESNGNSSSPSQAEVETPPSGLGKRKAELLESDSGTPGRNTPTPGLSDAAKKDAPPPVDTVRLWEDGYEERYYEQKFHVEPNNIAFRNAVARSYVEGLAWVLLYYMQGCPSWTWYYPYHYAPFAADFVDIAKVNVKFEKGRIFRPYEQLMGVMPAASSHTIPKPFRSLMTDEDSEIVEFYPKDFEVDLNGKKFAWQGVAILPFIDAERLLAAMATKYPELTDEERVRNEPGHDALIFSSKHALYREVEKNFYSKKQGAHQYVLDPKTSDHLMGKIARDDDILPYGGALSSPFPSDPLEHVEVDHSMTVHYEIPPTTCIHKSMLLRGVILPKPELNSADIEQTRSRASRSGRSYGGVPLNGHHGNGGYGGRDGRGGAINYSNPIAEHLNPNFNPNTFNANNFHRVPPPPHVAARMGFVPPPPPTMQASGAYWNGAGYNTGSAGWGYRGPPPGVNPGGRGGQGGGYRDSRDPYGNGNGSGNGNRNQGGYGGSGGYSSGGYGGGGR